ncbi:MAG: TetR/AcrR family transcriptional regulator [Acidimicrobiales bacterium]
MPTKAEQTERTRAALVAAARTLFAERGFADTSTEEVVRAAGVTRGALYHHFEDKRELFAAVYEDVEKGLANDLVGALGAITDPLEVLRRGFAAFLDACLDPAVQRIVLLEGPSVLGWERWREIDMRYGLGLVQGALQAAIEAGSVRAAPLEPLAHVLFGGLVEAAMLLAAANDPRRARREVGKAITVLFDGLAS